jgi:heptosyltransferase I
VTGAGRLPVTPTHPPVLPPASRIAIVRMSAIGDVVHVLPLVASLRSAVPDAHIAWVIQPAPYELVRHHPGVDEFLLCERRPLVRSLGSLRARLHGRRFDLVLALHTSVKASLVTALLRGDRKIGFDRGRAPELNWLFTTERLPRGVRGHAQDEILEFVDYLGVPRKLEWDLAPTPEEEHRYGPLLPPHAGPTVALVAASSLREKDWPPERFALLADELAATHGARSIIVGGRSPGETRAVAEIRRLARHPVLDLGAWDLRRLAYLVHRSDVLVSPDSGPLHIGVALGTPSVGLMAYTNPKRVGPYRFRDLMVDAFGEPHEEYGADAGYRPGRMRRITVDQVLEKVQLALATRRPAEGSAPRLATS